MKANQFEKYYYQISSGTIRMAYNPYIPWNDEMVVLLNLVITEGVHLAHKNDIIKNWNKVKELFFEQNELLPYKSAYKKDDH